MSQLLCRMEAQDSNSAPSDSKTDVGSSEKFSLLDWMLEPTPRIPPSDAVALPGLSLFDSADASDRVIVRKNSTEHSAYYKAQQATLRFNMGEKVGSGFFISGDGLIVTASHVVPEGQAKVNVNNVDGTEYSAELISRDVNNDLALLKIVETGKAAKFPFLSLNIKDAYREKLAAIGHPHGWPSVYISMGLGHSKPLKATQNWENADELLGIIAHVEGGNSGSAVIDGCGSVRGVMVGRGLGGLFGFAVPSKNIDKLIRWTYDRAPVAGINHEGGYRLAEYEVPEGSKNKVPKDKLPETEVEGPPKSPIQNEQKQQLKPEAKEPAAEHNDLTKPSERLPRPMEQQPLPEVLKKPGPGSFTSPYGKIYRNPTHR